MFKRIKSISLLFVFECSLRLGLGGLHKTGFPLCAGTLVASPYGWSCCTRGRSMTKHDSG